MKLARWLLAAYDVSSNSVVPNVPFEPFVDTALLFRRRLRTERSPGTVCRRTVPLLVFTWDTTRVPRYHDGLRRRPELFPVCEVHLGVKRLDESHLTEIHISLIEFSVCNLDFVLDSIIDENRINLKRKKNHIIYLVVFLDREPVWHCQCHCYCLSQIDQTQTISRFKLRLMKFLVYVSRLRGPTSSWPNVAW